MKSINPATGEVIREYAEHGDAEVARRIGRAEQTFESWRRTSFAQRGALMKRAAEQLRKERATYAHLMTSEMGKTIGAAEAEVEKCAWGCEFYAEHAERYLADEVVQTDARKSFVRYEPLGVLLAVMPWNFPFRQIFFDSVRRR